MLIISLSGPSGVGKNTILSEILANTDFVRTPHATSRPCRGDKNDYVFLSKQEFEDKIASGEIIEYTVFNDNYYGSFEPSADKNIMLMNYVGIKKIREYAKERGHIFKSFFLNLDEDIRKQRMLSRGENIQTINKRLKDDQINFENDRKYSDFMLDASKTPQEILQDFLEILDTQGLI